MDLKNINQYKDTEGITTKQLNFSLWLMRHKKFFRNIFIIFLIIISTISWFYTIYGFAYYLIKGIEEDKLLVAELIQTQGISHDYILKSSTKNLIVLPIIALKSKQNYDLITEIKNQNKKHWGEFKYCFLSQQTEIECAGNFILPNETKHILSLSNTFKYQPTNIKFIIKKITWHRINAHKITDWQKFKNEHLDITVQNIKVSSVNGDLSNQSNLNILEFTALNNTVYNYWEVAFSILFYNNTSVVKANKYILSEFMSGQTRQIQINLSDNIKNNNIKIIPEVNIMQDNVYLKQYDIIGEEK
ncbi:MAG: hypothetical protein V1768_02475 [Patescibacteria group bacterium]|nr:hypothetical protein [Patescibacteria group bacterium]